MTGRVAGRAARRLEERDGRPVRIPREPTPGSATDIDEGEPPPVAESSTEPDMSDEGDAPDMTRERARTERRDLDKERGEPVAGGAARGGPRALRTTAAPLGEWATGRGSSSPTTTASNRAACSRSSRRSRGWAT